MQRRKKNSGGIGNDVMGRNIRLKCRKRDGLTRYYVLHYGDGEWDKVLGWDMIRKVSCYFGSHYSEAVRLHNKVYGRNLRRYGAGYVTTNRETADKWVNDTLDTSKITTLVI
jgi:hypothetical protein